MPTNQGPVVQWIECQIPVLMIWVRIPSGPQSKTAKCFKLAVCGFLFPFFVRPLSDILKLQCFYGVFSVYKKNAVSMDSLLACPIRPIHSFLRLLFDCNWLIFLSYPKFPKYKYRYCYNYAMQFANCKSFL